MWIEKLSPKEARGVLGEHACEIVRMTLEVAGGRLPTRPDVLKPEDYEGALFHYGSNGPAVYLFLSSWQSVFRPGKMLPPPVSDELVIKVGESSAPAASSESVRWRDALIEAGYEHCGDPLANVWCAGTKVGLEVGSHAGKFVAAATAGELALMPQEDRHFFLDMMPWVRAGQMPCGWDDAPNRLIVEWLDPEQVAAYLEHEAATDYEENLWPTTAVGMRVRDEEAFGRAARETDNIILVRDASPAMLQYIAKSSFRPRPPYLTGVTRREPPHVGLIAAAETHAPPPEGFTVLDGLDGRLIRDQDGTTFYDGYELIGVYSLSSGIDAYSAAFRREMNRRLGEDLIQEGPYDSLAVGDQHRHPRPPVTAYMPDRAPVRLGTEQELNEFYEGFEIDWDAAYAND